VSARRRSPLASGAFLGANVALAAVGGAALRTPLVGVGVAALLLSLVGLLTNGAARYHGKR
jgi:hypothetical protein